MALPASPATAIVRNLNIENGLPCRPTRGARKITGPGLLARIARATSSISGLSTMSAAAAAPMSNSRLPIPNHPPHRHEHLGRVETGLGTPAVCPVTQRFQRTRMGVVAKLALVAGHCLQLRFESLAYVHPSVRDEGPGVSPFGAARGVEGVDELDEFLSRPGRDEHGLKDHVMVPVHVAPVLPVNNVRAHLANDRFHTADDFCQVDRVQTLVRKAEQPDVLHAESARRSLDMCSLADAGRAVAKRLTLADDDRGHAVARSHVASHRAATPEQLVVRMGGNDQDAPGIRHRLATSIPSSAAH